MTEKDPNFPDSPKSMVSIKGKPVLDHQIERLRKAGLTNNKVVVVRGHEGEQFTRTDIDYRDNDAFGETHSLHSLFCAEDAMADGFLLVYSDILFDESLIQRLIESEGDIVLLIDNSYRYHEHNVDKKLELAIGGRKASPRARSILAESPVHITKIGNQISKKEADFEFVGIAYFSEKGAQILREAYHEALFRDESPFQESSSFARATIVDIIQTMIDQGTPVLGLEIFTGWIEIHNRHDVLLAEGQIEDGSAIVG